MSKMIPHILNKQLAFVGIMMLKAFCISKSDALYYNLLLKGIHHLFIHSSDNSKDMLKKFYLKSNLEFREFTVWVLSRFYNSTNCDERKSCAELIRELINCKQYTSISEIEDMKKYLLDDSRKSIREILGEE